MGAALTTKVLTESEYAKWDAFVASSAQGSPYGTSQYLTALCEATAGSFRILAAAKGDELAGGIALYEQQQESRTRVAPRPLLYYNGLILREFATRYPSLSTARTLEASSAIEAQISFSGYEMVVLKNHWSFFDARSFIGQGWSVRPGYSYVVSISNIEAAWHRVEQNLRRLIRRSSQEGIRFTEDDDFDSFFRLHAATAARKGMSLYLPEDRFSRFIGRLSAQGLCRIYHARLPTGQSISAQIVLTGEHPVSHSVCAAADPEHLNTGATAFLRWKVFEALSALGYSANDLTDAALNPVTHFKSQLGGDLKLCLICEKTPAAENWGRKLKTRVARLVGR
jgi:hypothetical protein